MPEPGPAPASFAGAPGGVILDMVVRQPGSTGWPAVGGLKKFFKAGPASNLGAGPVATARIDTRVRWLGARPAWPRPGARLGGRLLRLPPLGAHLAGQLPSLPAAGGSTWKTCAVYSRPVVFNHLKTYRRPRLALSRIGPHRPPCGLTLGLVFGSGGRRWL